MQYIALPGLEVVPHGTHDHPASARTLIVWAPAIPRGSGTRSSRPAAS